MSQRPEKADIPQFLLRLEDFYRQQGRHTMSWRLPDPTGSFDPYRIMVSEIMLQQTQAGRVEGKYHQFLEKFPTVLVLSQAPLAEVLAVWSGLGYNRRAKYLWETAGAIQREHKGRFPMHPPDLLALPGIGLNTAGAIIAYAFNQPVVFVETNIRTVIIHHFLSDKNPVADKEVRQVIESLVRELPEIVPHLSYREFYWALMDYGTHLKKTIGNLSRNSASYTRQSRFEGSARQLRGQVLRLLAPGPLRQEAVIESLADERAGQVVEALILEGMIRHDGELLRLG